MKTIEISKKQEKEVKHLFVGFSNACRYASEMLEIHFSRNNYISAGSPEKLCGYARGTVIHLCHGWQEILNRKQIDECYARGYVLHHVNF